MSEKTSPLPVKPKRRAWLVVLLLLILSPLALFGAIVAPGPLAQNTTVVVPHGANIHAIAALLEQNGAVYKAIVFRLAAKLVSYDDLKAGEYLFVPHQSAADIALMMHEGKSVVHMFTVTEGMTSAEAVKLLKADSILSGDITTVPPDGSLLPETYRYSYGDSRAGMIVRMQKAMKEALDDLWAKRDTNLPIQTQEQAVTMASIVEKETGKPQERARVAGVFYNRLRHSMRLQSDPTVIYAIVQAKGPLYRALDHDDLAYVSPYNTYTSDGLPPAPICNPGKATLEAALHPETNDYFYFVADGTGGHVFAHDLDEHNRNVAHWNQINRVKP